MGAGHAYGQVLLGTGGPGLLPGFRATLGSFYHGGHPLGFPCGSVVKSLRAMQELQETQVPSLSQEDPLEKEMATPSSILA